MLNGVEECGFCCGMGMIACIVKKHLCIGGEEQRSMAHIIGMPLDQYMVGAVLNLHMFRSVVLAIWRDTFVCEALG